MTKLYATLRRTEQKRFEIQDRVLSLSPLLQPCLPVELIIYHSALIGLSKLCKGCFPDRTLNQTLTLTCTHKNMHVRTHWIYWQSLSCSQTDKKLHNLINRILTGKRKEKVTMLVTRDAYCHVFPSIKILNPAWVWTDGANQKCKRRCATLVSCEKSDSNADTFTHYCNVRMPE